MSAILDGLAARRETLVVQATAIAQKGVTEGRDLTVEENTAFGAMLAEAEGLDTRMKGILEGENRAKDIESSFRGSKPDESRSSSDGAFGKWARESRGGDGYDMAHEWGAEKRALDKWRGGAESRAMSATLGAGPSSVYSRLYEYAVSTSEILQAGCQIINTSDGNTLPMPKVTVHATGASAAANANITATDSTLATTDLAVTKGGYITYVPSELLQDATFDVEEYIARNAGRELGRLISAKASTALSGFTVTGVTGPTGTASGTLGAQATADRGGDVLIDLFHSVLPEYRGTAAWLMGDATAALVRKLKDSAGQYVWEKSLQLGDPASIIGKGVYIDPFMSAYTGVAASDSGKKVIYFGDFSALAVRIAGGLRFERSNEVAFAADQVAFRAIVRSGAVALDPNAVKFLIFS